jgi:phosphatidylinositol dimannoside acyltransferase
VPDAPGRAAYLAYRAGAELARALPPAWGRGLARVASRGMTTFWSTRRRQVERSLRRASGGTLEGPALARATAQVFENYGLYWHELFRLRGNESLEQVVDSKGYEHISDPQAEGRGVILALPHLGNWDRAGAWLAGRGHKLTVVAEPVEPPELGAWFVAERGALGMEVVFLGPNSVVQLLKALRAGHVVCLVSDRDLTGDGIEVEFFGEKTTMPGGPAALALRTGAPLVPVGNYFLPNSRQLVNITEPLEVERRGRLRDDVSRLTQDLAHRFEELIRAAPEQWLMMQPMWPSDAEQS